MEKRIIRELAQIEKERENLSKSGIYFHYDEANIRKLQVMIIGKEKKDSECAELYSPYAGGFFVFDIDLPSEYPMDPPQIKFHPQQSLFRLHPNYYQCGKVCLSSINTWGGKDWAPSVSLIALSRVLEERLNERARCFEPALEKSTNAELIAYNTMVEYAVHKVCLVDIVRNKKPPVAFQAFTDVIRKHFFDHYESEYKPRVEALIAKPIPAPTFNPSSYGGYIHNINYVAIGTALAAAYAAGL